MKTFCSLVLVFALLASVACTGSQVITSLDVAVTAAELALPLVAGTIGMSPAMVSSIETYLADADQALALAAQEQASSDSDQIKAAKILAFFAQVQIPNLTGAPAAVVKVLKTLATDIAAYLANWQPITAKSAGPALTYKTKPGTNDAVKLESIRAQALANLAKVRAAQQK